MIARGAEDLSRGMTRRTDGCLDLAVGARAPVIRFARRGPLDVLLHIYSRSGPLSLG